MAHNGKQFAMNPPAIVQRLIDAKLREKGILAQFDKCVEKEREARNEVKRVLLEKLSPAAIREDTTRNRLERELNEERVRREDCESRLRELEIAQLRSKPLN